MGKGESSDSFLLSVAICLNVSFVRVESRARAKAHYNAIFPLQRQQTAFVDGWPVNKKETC